MSAGGAHGRSLAAALAWAAAGALACAGVAPLEPNLLEEGFALHVAQRLVAGERLYRDIVFYSGPVPFELLGWLFRGLGDGIFVARGAVVALHGVATGLLYATARRAGAGPLAHAAAAALATAPVLLFPFFSIYFHTTIAFYLAVIAVYAGLRGAGGAGWAAAAGAGAALVALSKQSVGALLALALLAALAAAAPRGRRRARALAFVAGGAALAALVLAAHALRGTLGPLLHGVVVLPLSLGGSFRAPPMNLWPPGVAGDEVAGSLGFYLPKLYHLLAGGAELRRAGPKPPSEPGSLVILATQLLFALPWLALLATALRALRRPFPAALGVPTAGLLALAGNLYPRADFGHLVFALPLAAAQLLILSGVGGDGRPRRGPGPWLAGAAVLLALGAGSAAAVRQLHAFSRPPSLGPRVPLRPVSVDAESIVPAVSYLRERVRPGEAIFVARAEPLVYFATGTRNPTPFEGVVPGFREEQEERILAGLPQARYVVISDVDQPFMTFYAEELPRVQDYLERHFRLPEDWRFVYSPTLVLERAADRGPAAVDLVERWPDGRAWLRDAQGAERPLAEPLPRLATRHNRRPVPLVLGPRGGGVDLELAVPPGAVFQGDVGLVAVMSERQLERHPQRLWMEVAVARQGGAFETLYALQVGRGPISGRHWHPLEVDLAAYAGERVTLRLAARAERPLPAGALSWWGSPRIAQRPEPEAR